MTMFTPDSMPHQWLCDTCQQPVTNSGGDAGILTARNVARSDGSHRWEEFRITHKNSPDRQCDTNQDDRDLSWELSTLTGMDGMNRYLTFLSYGPVALSHQPGSDVCRVGDFTSYTDVFRRLYVPGYEQARPFFASHAAGGMQENFPAYTPYTQEGLAALIQHHR